MTNSRLFQLSKVKNKYLNNKMKLVTLPAIVAGLAATVSADFYIGVLSGEGIDTLETSTKYTVGFLARDGQSICDAPSFPIDIPKDPFGPWWNVCGIGLKSYCDGKDLVMNPDNFCGKNRMGDQTVDDGFFYADLLDRGDNNRKVGRCVFEWGGSHDCASNGSYMGGSTLRCYTSAC